MIKRVFRPVMKIIHICCAQSSSTQGSIGQPMRKRVKRHHRATLINEEKELRLIDAEWNQDRLKENAQMSNLVDCSFNIQLDTRSLTYRTAEITPGLLHLPAREREVLVALDEWIIIEAIFLACCLL